MHIQENVGYRFAHFLNVGVKVHMAGDKIQLTQHKTTKMQLSEEVM